MEEAVEVCKVAAHRRPVAIDLQTAVVRPHRRHVVALAKEVQRPVWPIGRIVDVRGRRSSRLPARYPRYLAHPVRPIVRVRHHSPRRVRLSHQRPRQIVAVTETVALS